MVSLYFFLFILVIFGCAASSLLHELSSSCDEWRLLFVAVRRPATAPAAAGSAVTAPGL